MGEVAEFSAGGIPSLGGIHSAGEIVLLSHLEVKPELILDVGVDIGSEEPEVTPPERLPGGGHQTEAGLSEAGASSAAKTARAYRVQVADSAFSAWRPAVVSA